MAVRMIAALFVQKNGVYFNVPGIDPWDEERDARRYAGPWPVIAHPPCKRWGRYATGGPQAPGQYAAGDDEGRFASAIHSTRWWGGVLEHPQNTMAWPANGIDAPPASGGWVPSGDGLGYTCSVEQGWYGHAAQKATWLYVVGVERVALPELHWGSSKELVERRMAETGRKIRTRGIVESLSKRQRAATPVPFRDLLVRITPSAEEDKSLFPKVPRFACPVGGDEPPPAFRDVLIRIARRVKPEATLRSRRKS